MIRLIPIAFYPHYLPAFVRGVETLGAAFVRAGLEVETLFVRNNPALNGCRLPGDSIEHDNHGAEFGAYQRGLDHVAGRLAEDDVVVFMNDTFCVHHSFSPVYRRNFVNHVLSGLEENPASFIVGKGGARSCSFCIEGLRIHRWISTNVFALNVPALRELQYRLHVPKLDAYVPGGPTLESFFSGALDRELQAHIKSWLFATTGKDRWYKSEPLSPENAGWMADKARAILQEKYLSARLEYVPTNFRDIRLRRFDDAVSHVMLSAIYGLRIVNNAALVQRSKRARAS